MNMLRIETLFHLVTPQTKCFSTLVSAKSLLRGASSGYTSPRLQRYSSICIKHFIKFNLNAIKSLYRKLGWRLPMLKLLSLKRVWKMLTSELLKRRSERLNMMSWPTFMCMLLNVPLPVPLSTLGPLLATLEIILYISNLLVINF